MSARKTVSEPNFPSPESTSKTDVGGGLRMFLGRGLGAHRGSNGKENRFPIKLMMLSIRKLRAIKQRASARRPVGAVSVVQCRYRSLVAELRVAVGANYRLIGTVGKRSSKLAATHRTLASALCSSAFAYFHWTLGQWLGGRVQRCMKNVLSQASTKSSKMCFHKLTGTLGLFRTNRKFDCS